jgi:ATP-dependent exoDNAse (exonuclease V) beta subunit
MVNNINYLAMAHHHSRDKNIRFKDEGHIYTISLPGSLEPDTGYTSVTTFVHSFIEPFNADKIIDNMMTSNKWPKNKYFGMTKQEIKAGWKTKGNNAAKDGTKLHYDIECYYNNMEVNNSSIEYGHFQGFVENYFNLTPYRTEWIIYDEKLRIAGSIDMVFKNDDGSFDIYDWKRVKDITKNNTYNKFMKTDVVILPDTNYWHYALQLNVYKAILINMYKLVVRDLYLVSLHPENKSYIRIKVADLQPQVELLFKQKL